mmetsp:Transcript_9480/g.29517  ORF Transcript_9480/g.29517 Transcript_9480/m.29517 type:complete len:148 (-) Transcript_9480:106-549(-)
MLRVLALSSSRAVYETQLRLFERPTTPVRPPPDAMTAYTFVLQLELVQCDASGEEISAESLCVATGTVEGSSIVFETMMKKSVFVAFTLVDHLTSYARLAWPLVVPVASSSARGYSARYARTPTVMVLLLSWMMFLAGATTPLSRSP